MKKKLLLLSALMIGYGFSATPAFAVKDDSAKPAVTIPNGYKLSYIKVGKIKKDIVKDYGAKSSDTKDQTAIFQKAINEISEKGGGTLLIPNGTYCFMSLYMKSNVHIRVESGVTLKPYLTPGVNNGVMLIFSEESEKLAAQGKYIENVSIKSTDGKQFTVDYSNLIRPTDKKKAAESKGKDKFGMRFMISRMVKNFEISDVKILDNITTYCSMIFVPISERTKGLTTEIVDSWEVSCPTNGVMTNCSMFNASSGYGLFQLHGAQDLHFEDLYSLGGVTLRLETGAAGKYGGVYDITARNIVNEKGLSALMLGPHTIVNGLVTAENIKSISSCVAVSAGNGFIDENGGNKGYFADGCTIRNVHAVYGTNAQVHYKSLSELDESLLKDLSWGYGADGKRGYRGPSHTAVEDKATLYKISFSNVTVEGFPAVSDKDGYKSPEDMESINKKLSWERKDWAEEYLSKKYPDHKPLKGNGADCVGTYQQR